MKKFLILLMVAGLFACDNNSKVGTKLDSLKDKVDTSLGKIVDSAKAKGERGFEDVKEKIQDLRDKKDSLKDSAR